MFTKWNKAFDKLRHQHDTWYIFKDFLEIQEQLNQSVKVDDLKAAVYQETGTPLVLIDEAFEDLLEFM
jgi:hypothetical protein